MPLTAFVLLGLASRTPVSVYDAAETLSSHFAGIWHESLSSLYAAALRLQRAGLAVLERGRGPRQRRRLRLTDAGHATLRRWLATPPGPREVRDEHVVRAAFSHHGATLPFVEALEAERRRAERRARYQQHLIGTPDPFELIGPETLSTWALRRWLELEAQARERWCSEVRSRLVDADLAPRACEPVDDFLRRAATDATSPRPTLLHSPGP